MYLCNMTIASEKPTVYRWAETETCNLSPIYTRRLTQVQILFKLTWFHVNELTQFVINMYVNRVQPTS